MIKRLFISAILIAGTVSSMSWAQVQTSTTSTGGGSVNGALNDAKKNNTWGLVANIAGAGLHGVDAAVNWGQCGSQNYAACARAAVQTMLAISSMAQAGSHGSSNQNLTPDLCKTAAGICNPNQFQWPDFNSCPSGDVNCYNTVINNSGNPDLGSVFSGPGISTGPGTSTSSAFNDYNKMIETMTKAGATFDPKTGAINFQGKTITPNDVNNPNALKNLGLTDADLAKMNASKANIDKAIAGLGKDPTVQSAIDGAVVNAAMAAANGGASLSGLGGKGSGSGLGSGSGTGGDGSLAGVGLDVIGGGGEGSGAGAFGADGDDPNGSGRKGGSRSLKDRMARVPASVAGKKRMFNGEPIGVAGDSIFDMMTRRYQVKTQQNSFLEQVVIAPK